jgi:uncharacterized membrane-anchored protein YitT (DUF2179 family)
VASSMKKLVYILIGILLTSIGVIVLKHSNIVTGGTAGLTLSMTYLTGFPFAIIFFLINLPFYLFSVIQLGWKFTLSTIGSVTALSLITSIDQWLPHFSIPMLVGSVGGGFFIGIGLSIVLLNGSSLGGANILSLFLQKKYGFNPAKVNFLFDLLVVCSCLFTVGFLKGIFSIVSIYVTAQVFNNFKNEIAVKNSQATKTEKFTKSSPQKPLTLAHEQ